MAKDIIMNDWTTFKNLLISKDRKLQEESVNTTHYNLFFQDNQSIYTFSVEKGTADETDYVANYRPTVNESYVEKSTFEGTITAEQARYSPRFYTNKNDISLSQSVDTEIVNIDFDGQLDAISANFTRDDIEFVIEVDGVEILRIRHDDLESSGEYNLKQGEGYGRDD